MDSQNILTSNHIIEAIDGCRKRKARPDIDRIIKWIHRKYSFAKEEILQALNASVDDGSVIKVRYKDSISYRNPAKFTRNSAHNYVATIRQHQAIIARAKATQETKVSLNGSNVTDANSSYASTSPNLTSNETNVDANLSSISASTPATPGTTSNDTHVNAKMSPGCLNVPRPNLVRTIGPSSTATATAVSSSSASSVLPINAVKRILRIVRQIVLQQGDHDTINRGASISAILSNLHAQRQMNYTEAFVAKVLRRASAQGTVTQLPNGNYILAGIKKALVKKANHGTLGQVRRSVINSSGGNCPSGGAFSSTGPHSTAGALARSMANRPSVSGSFRSTTGGSFKSRNSDNSEPQRASKRRKIKKDLGPDFLEPSDLGMPFLNESFIPKCSQCKQTESSNKYGKAEKFLECKDCDYKAHPSCMRYPPELVYRCRQSPWQCVFCKDCCKCEGSGQVESILLCDLCDKGYHMECHDPPLRSKPPGSWVCSDCLTSRNGIKGKSAIKTHETESDAGFDETSASSGGGFEEEVDDDNISDGESGESSSISEEAILPIKHTDTIARDGMEKIFLNLQPSIDEIAIEFPNIRNKPDHWTPQDVESFIKVIGFPEQASSFRDQEIDGIALLLLKRVDILTGMSLKLGPALKIYGQIQRLQTIHNQ